MLAHRPPPRRAPLRAPRAQAANGAPVYALLGYPAHHRAFLWSTPSGRAALVAQLDGLHALGIPYNVAFSPRGHATVFARTKAQPDFSWRVYGERLGGFELAGIFTAFQENTYAALDEESVAAMLRLATVPMPPAAQLPADAARA